MRSVIHCDWARAWSDFAPTVLRIATGLVFFMHGYQKLGMGVEGVAGFLGSIGFPMASFFAVLLIGGEIVGGAALVLGLYARLAGKVTAIIALVALLTVHVSKGFFISTGGFEFILLLLAASLSIMATGAGAFSLDRQLNTPQK